MENRVHVGIGKKKALNSLTTSTIAICSKKNARSKAWKVIGQHYSNKSRRKIRKGEEEKTYFYIQL